VDFNVERKYYRYSGAAVSRGCCRWPKDDGLCVKLAQISNRCWEEKHVSIFTKLQRARLFFNPPRLKPWNCDNLSFRLLTQRVVEVTWPRDMCPRVPDFEIARVDASHQAAL